MSNWQDLPDETQQPQPATSRSGNAWVDLPPANVRPAAIGALTANPDRTVQDALLAQRYKTTPSLVGAARTTFEERAAADDAAKIMLEAPKLSGWYTMAPENAALVKDDLQNAADLERLLESMRPDYLRGVKLPEVVFPKVQSQTDGSIWERTTRAWQEGQAGNRIAVHGFLQMPLDGLAEMFPSQFGNLAEANREKIQGYREWVKQTPYSTAEGGKKAWEDFVRSSPLMATQISLGLLGGGVTIPTAFMGTQISGSQYADLTESDVNGGRAFFAALGNTAMQLPLEAIQLNRFMNIFKGSGLGQIARRVGESALTSFVTESLQNYPDALTTLWAKSTRTGQNPMSQFLNNLGQYTFDGMYEGLLSIPWALLGGSGRIAYDIGRYRTLNKDVEFFHALDGSAAASKLKERLPQAYHNLVDHMTAGGPVQSLYISPAAMRSAIADENVLYQTANDMGVSQEAFNRAEELGADLEVPLNLYQGKIAGTEVSLALRGEVRTSPEGMTLTEQTAFSQSFRQQVETAVAEYRDNLLQDDELNTALAPIETELAAVYGKEGARANVALLRARANMAAQAWREAGKNITPAQWVQEVAKLRVAVEGQVQSMAGSGLSASVDKDFAKVTPKAHDVLAKPVKDVLVHNGVETLDDLYALAGQAKEGFQSGIASIAKATGGQPMFRPGDGLKGRARAHEKIDRDYPEMGAKRVLDMLGGTILYDSRADVEKALPEIERLVQEAGWEIIPARTKNRFDKPSSGYKDYFLNIRQPNGLVTELLLTTKAMNQAKTEGAGHYLYEAMQKAEAVLKDKNATKEEKKEAKRIRASLDEASEGYYGSTGDQSNETASISEIVEPLNKISAPGASSAISNLYGELEPLLGNIRKMLPSSANTNGISSHSINFLTNTGELGPSDSQGIPTASRPSMNRAINGLSDISEPPSNANNIVQDGTQNKGDRRIAGAETAIILGAHGEQKARYEVRELADIIPSHDPENQFTKRTDYPNNVQERPYHSDAGEQEKVRGNALRLDLRLVVNNNPDLTNGPPAITENGIVLGGNSRAMSIQLAYANNSERAMAYKDAIVSQAAGFGLDGTAVATMERPVLVRVVEGGDTADMGKLARLYNQTMMQGLQSKAEGVSKARLFSADTLATLSADMATFDSLREFLGHTASKPFISALLRDGILEQTQLARLTENNGRLNDTGKKLVEDALRGLIVPDYDILSSIPASALNKLDRVIPALARMKAQGEGWDMSGMVTAALRQIANATTEGKKVDVFLAQGDLIETDPDKKRPAVQALALTFANATQKEVQARFELMARDSEKRTKGQNVLVAMPENTPAQSFQTAFMGTIAAVDGQSFARFAPQADPLHAALDYAHKNGGKGHSVAAALEKLQKSLVNKKATAEQKEAAKEMSQQLSRFSGTVAVYSPKLGTFFQYQPGKELFQADTALARDAKAWGKAVDAIAASGKAPSSPVLMLGQTPLVMQMLGAEERPIYAAPHMFDGTHKNITPDMIKSLPKALADPIAVFQSQTHHDRLVFMLELMDAQGATVVVPVQLDGTKYRSTIHIATTAYAKEKNGRPDNAWFAKQAENALYINRAKEKRWLMVSGSYSLWDAASTLSKKIVRTDADLVNLRQENLELYQGQNIGARGSIAFNDNETLIRLFKDSADFSTFIHEIGHLFVKDMENMVATGQAPEQVVRDLEIMKAFTAEFSDPDTLRGFYKKSFRPQRAPFKERDFSSLTDAERIEVRNVAKQEKLAQAFETYMSEGKAPSVALRPVFQRFRIWLQRIYQALTGQVSINPEIRGVFDRMLASDQDTLLAEQVHHAQSAEIAALDAVAAKMLTEQEQGRLAKARENAAAVSREQRLKKVLQAYYRAAVNRKEIRAQAADTVNSMPVYAAQDQAIAEGGIHLDAVREEYGADVANAILKKRPGLLRKEGTVSLHDLAIVHGFAGEEALLDAICQSSGKKAEISSLVKAEIAAREEAIRKEIGLDNGINSGDLDYYSDQRLEALEMEARALSRASGEHGPKGRTFGTAETLRALARRMLESMPYRETVNIGRLSAAEAKQAARAAQAAADGDMDTAADAKRRQAINHAMVLEALQYKHEAEVFTRALKRFVKSNRMVFEYQDQIRAMVERYKLAPGIVPHKPDERENLQDFIKRHTADSVFDAPPFSDFILHEHVPQNMTLGELREVRDAVRWLAEEGNPEEARLLSDDVNGTVAEAAALGVATLQASGNKFTPKTKGTWKRKVQDGWQDMFAGLDHIKFMMMAADGYEEIGQSSQNAGFHSKWFERVMEALTRFLTMFRDARPEIDRIAAIRGNFIQRFEKRFGKRAESINGVHTPEVMQEIGWTHWTAEHIWCVARNMGNAGNLKTLHEGLSLTDADLRALTSVLSRDEWLAIQAEGDLMGKHFDESDKIFRQVCGRPMPDKIEPLPLTVSTVEGNALDLPGWYFPISVDGHLNPEIGDKQDIDMAKASPDFVAYGPAMAKGFTKSRTGTGLAPALYFGVMDTALQDQWRFIAMATVIRDMDRITRNRDWRTAYTKAFGPKSYNELRAWLKYTARPVTERGDGLDSFMNNQRKLATIFSLGLNTSTFIRQFQGYFQAVPDLGAKWILKGISRAAHNPMALVRYINGQSLFMADRDKNFVRELRKCLVPPNDILKVNVAGQTYTREDVQTVAMSLVTLGDRLTSYPIWQGAYIKATENLNMGHNEAVAYANSLIQKTQASNTDADLNRWQREDGKSWKRLFSMFMSEALRKGSRMRYYWRAYQHKSIGIGDYVTHLCMESVAPAIFYTVMRALLTSSEPEPEEVAEQIFNELTGPLPFISQLCSVVSYRYGPKSMMDSPAFQGIDLFTELIKDTLKTMEKPTSSKVHALLFKSLVDVAAFGLGTGNVRRVYEIAAEGWEDMESGDTVNPFRLFFRKPYRR